MEVQATAGAISAYLSSPLVRDVTLVAIPVLFSALMYVVQAERSRLKKQFHEGLNLITEQNKQIADLKVLVGELDSRHQRSQGRLIDLKEQIDALNGKLEKARDEFNVQQRYSRSEPLDDHFSGFGPDETQGFAELLRSLEQEPARQPPSPPSPAAAPHHGNALFQSEAATRAGAAVPQSATPQPPRRRAPSPDMTQSMHIPLHTDPHFDLQEYL